MNILDMNIKDNINNIIDAYVEVYGEKYRNTIERRINKIFYIFHNDVDGIENYHYFLSQCKKKELALKFLRQIGVDVSKHETKNYAEDLDRYIQELLYNYFNGFSFGIHPLFKNDPVGIKAFRSINDNNDEDPKRVKANRIKFINFLRGKEVEKITEDTFDEFSKTDEYKHLLNKINGYLKIYDKILLEFEDYLKKIEPYKKYVDTETERKKNILNRKKNELFEEIEMFLPDDIEEYLNSKCHSISEKCDMFLHGDINCKSYVEYFADIYDDSSDSVLTSHFRSYYLKYMGIEINPADYLSSRLSDDFIEKEDIKKIIPPIEVIKKITACRLEKYEEAQNEYIYNSQDFIKNFMLYGNTIFNKNAIFKLKKDKSVCVTSSNNNLNFFLFLSFTVRKDDGGILDHSMLHEICHCIETHSYIFNQGVISGFDIATNSADLNPYNDKKRKYERLNENIADIFAIEARKILHSKGIYIIEPKRHIIANVKNHNTGEITKQMLMPLLTKYREQVIEARLLGKRKELFDVIGEDNFEELNDVINKVDYLLSQGLMQKLDDNKMEDEMVIEYRIQLERVKQIYEKMDNYIYNPTITSHIR